MATNNKFELEKKLHEIIRDLPAGHRINHNFERGIITLDEALKLLATVYRNEREKEAN